MSAPKKTEIKTYVVLQRQLAARNDKANEKVVAVKLTHSAAQSIVDALPGTHIEKHVADKQHE